MKRVVRFVLWAVMALANPAHSEELIDYEALLRAHAATVITERLADGTTVRSLNLGNGITVTCNPSGCIGLDKQGATGCFFSILVEAYALSIACGEAFDSAETERLTKMLPAFAAEIGEGAFPPRSAEAVMSGFVHPKVAAYTADAALCTSLDPETRGFLSAFASRETLDQAMAQMQQNPPRLPVMNPCL